MDKQCMTPPAKSAVDKIQLIPEFLKTRGLVKGHLDSYNYSIDTGFKKIVRFNNDIRSSVDHKLSLKFKDLKVGEPSVVFNGVAEKIIPHMCRVSDMTVPAVSASSTSSALPSEKWAFLSVVCHRDLISLGKRLSSLGYTLVSCGDTVAHLREHGLVVVDAKKSYPDWPESLHPNFFLSEFFLHHLKASDSAASSSVLVINLYEYDSSSARFLVSPGAMEPFGLLMIQTAEENDVLVVPDHVYYAPVLDIISKGEVPIETKEYLTKQAHWRVRVYLSLKNEDK